MDEVTSVADLMGGLKPFQTQITIALVALPLGGVLLGRALLSLRKRVGLWFLSLVVHGAVFMVVPPLVVLLYLAFGTGTNLFTDVDAPLVFGPLISGAATLLLVPQIMDLDLIPGFHRLRGLMGLVALSFGGVFMLSRTRFSVWLWVRPSMTSLLLVAVLVYLAFKVCVDMITNPGRTPELDIDLND